MNEIQSLRVLNEVLDQHAIVSIADTSGNITYANDRFCQISNYTRDELVGQNHRMLRSGVHDANFFADMWLTISSGRTWHGEICNRKKDGGLYWVETTIVPSLDEDGLPSRYVSMRTDITGIKQAEEALVRIKADLEELVQERTTELEQAQSHLLQSDKMASIGQLAAGVAHEINNPIGYVYSNLGTLEKYVQDTFSMLDLYEQAEGAIADAEVLAQLGAAKNKFDIAFIKEDLRSLMDESKDGITRVKNIVQNLKDFSHVDTTDEWHCADLHQGLDSTLNIVSNEIKYKAEVTKEYGDLPDVECLSSQLNQVFMNLLVNAAHAIDERGTITIRTGTQGDDVWVEISDTGRGVAPEHMAKIFDPFFTTKPVGKGTGLGLSLSYGILQKHHGRIEVRSIVGLGTTFRVSVPVRQPLNVPA